MPVEDPEQLMKTVIEAWGQADLRPLFDALDENIVWKSASTARIGALRFGGEYRGRVSVVELLSSLSTTFYFARYTAKEIISKGEVVWGLFDAVGTYIPVGSTDRTRNPLTFETAIRWRIRNGKILEAQNFYDTAAMLAQQTIKME